MQYTIWATDIIKLVLKETECEVLQPTNQLQGRVKYTGLVKVMDLRLP
jgi:hypothetical protein